MQITPFTVHFSDDDLDDLRGRLANTRWPDQLPGQEWVYGAELSEVQSIVAYWLNEYDWRAAEAELNRWPQFTATIQDEQVHFLHVESEREGAVPLLLTHGWPGSIVEFLHLIDGLTSPSDPNDQPFHVIVPSLPGFGLSGPTVTTGVSPKRIASMWVELMAGLGYESYVAQGGDWGAIITAWIGQLDPDHCAGVHLNMVVAPPNQEMMAEATPQELEMLGQLQHFQAQETGYQAIQGTKPQSLAFAHADSPAGLCAWIYEKFYTWSDCNGEVFSVHDRDRFCTNVMLYWLTNTAGSAARIYYEFQQLGRETADAVPVPMAGAVFPKEIYRASRRWAELRYQIVHWSTPDRGGHFAALEVPDLLIADVRSFVAELPLSD